MRTRKASRYDPTLYDWAIGTGGGAPKNHAALLRTPGADTPHHTGEGNAYRLYATQTLDLVRFIRAAQGATLADVRTLLALGAGGTACCKDVQPLITTRLAESSQRLEKLRQIQQVLHSFLAMCHTQAQDALCPVVAALAGAPSSFPPSP